MLINLPKIQTKAEVEKSSNRKIKLIKSTIKLLKLIHSIMAISSILPMTKISVQQSLNQKHKLKVILTYLLNLEIYSKLTRNDQTQ